jgi:hypothetical protein
VAREHNTLNVANGKWIKTPVTLAHQEPQRENAQRRIVVMDRMRRNWRAVFCPLVCGGHHSAQCRCLITDATLLGPAWHVDQLALCAMRQLCSSSGYYHVFLRL